MQKYIVKINSGRVMSVFANSEEQARKEAKRQLSKPGRRGILKQWHATGSIIQKEGS